MADASFADFIGEVRARLEKGRETYGDRSFSAEPSALLEELRQETLDLAGWGFILWTRLKAMADALPCRVNEPPGRLVGKDRVAP